MLQLSLKAGKYAWKGINIQVQFMITCFFPTVLTQLIHHLVPMIGRQGNFEWMVISGYSIYTIKDQELNVIIYECGYHADEYCECIQREQE